VAIQTAKWARELVSRGASIQVVLWRDRARGRNRRVDLSEFQGIDCQEVTFNSRDKKSIVSKEVSRQLQVKSGDVVVATALYDPYCDFIVGLCRTGDPILYVQNVVSDAPSVPTYVRQLDCCFES
jgi:hypothetical protein